MSTVSKENSADFVVRLDGLRLDDAARSRLAGAVQAAVMAELGKLDLTGGRPVPTLAYLPLKWRGIWLRDIEKLPEGFGQLAHQLEVVER
jgi:hypothetical protein